MLYLNTKHMPKDELRKKASQPPKQSWWESVLNVAIGFGINFSAQLLLYPMFGVHIALHQNLSIAVIFTVISVIRSYTVRRWFNNYHVKRIDFSEHI